jgi:Ca-activated chloride channel family protein
MVTLIGVLAAFALAALGEALHARRVRRLARLAFGPKARPAVWARAATALRAPAFAAVAWGLFTLVQLPPRVHQGEDVVREQDWRRLVLVLDVSPSMRLQDAGPTAEQSRARRARDLIDSLFQRVAIARYKISVVAVYNGAKPVVIDTTDSEVVRNILSDLPMQYAFPSGKTKLLDGIEEAAKIAKPWPARSTMVVLVTDGDTVPATGMPTLPPSISGVLVVGVGDPLAGKFIDGHQSRQDASALRQIAARLGGAFHDGNRLQLPTDLIREAAQESEDSALEKLTIREYALLAIALGSAFLALLPFLLHFLGTAWRPGAQPAGAAPGRSLVRAGG